MLLGFSICVEVASFVLFCGSLLVQRPVLVSTTLSVQNVNTQCGVLRPPPIGGCAANNRHGTRTTNFQAEITRTRLRKFKKYKQKSWKARKHKTLGLACISHGSQWGDVIILFQGTPLFSMNGKHQALQATSRHTNTWGQHRFEQHSYFQGMTKIM